MRVLVVSGTGTGVGKTVLTAALAALGVAAGRRVAVLKPAQTGVGPDDDGDVDVVATLAGPVTTRELRRYPDPLAPDTAAARSGRAPVRLAEITAAVAELAGEHQLVLVEGAGGVAVRLDPTGATMLDVAAALAAPVLLAVSAGLGTLNDTALTCEALARRRVPCAGLVIGSWPGKPALAERCNLHDLPVVAGAPLLGALPEGAPAAADFTATSRAALSPVLGGEFAVARFVAEQGDAILTAR